MVTTLIPTLSTTPGQPLSYNVGIAETFSWIPVENNANRPLYAQAVYDVNSSKTLGMKGFTWVSGPGSAVGPFAGVLLTTTSNGETHAKVASLTAIDGSVATNFIVLGGTYVYNVEAFNITDSKTGVIAYY